MGATRLLPVNVLEAIANFLSRCQVEAKPLATDEALGAIRMMFPDLDISDADLGAAIASEASIAGFNVGSISSIVADRKNASGEVVALFADKRWKAILDYRTGDGTKSIQHFFEEVSDLHLIVEHGPDWNSLVRCTLTLNRPDDGEEQNSVEKSRRQEREH